MVLLTPLALSNHIARYRYPALIPKREEANTVTPPFRVDAKPSEAGVSQVRIQEASVLDGQPWYRSAEQHVRLDALARQQENAFVAVDGMEGCFLAGHLQIGVMGALADNACTDCGGGSDLSCGVKTLNAISGCCGMGDGNAWCPGGTFGVSCYATGDYCECNSNGDLCGYPYLPS